MTSGVYGMKHNKTQKWYIGVSKNIEKRIKVHIYDLRTWPDESCFSRDIRDYGWYIESYILEECEPVNFNQKEKIWVKFMDSKNNGYNRQSGGGNHRDWKNNGSKI